MVARETCVPSQSGRGVEGRVKRTAATFINEAALKLWPDGENPIGARLQLGVLEHSAGDQLTRS